MAPLWSARRCGATEAKGSQRGAYDVREALHRYGSPDNHELRAGRAVVLRLSYRRILHRPEASRPSLASVGSTDARTGRSGAFKLANAASRIGGGFFWFPISASQGPVRESDRLEIVLSQLRPRRPAVLLFERPPYV